MGQNFLLSNSIKNKIVKSANICDDDLIIEVGPGFGAITQLLVAQTKQVVAIELDKRLYDYLKHHINASNFYIINNDILKVDIDKLIEEYSEFKKVKLVANLPYSISSKIVLKIIKSKYINEAYIMVQKEMAQRIAASINSSDYNAFSVFVQLFVDTKILFTVPPKEFHPAPKVDSAVVHIKNRFDTVDFDVDKIEKFLRICFLNKRKKLLNNLSNVYDKQKIMQMFDVFNIDLNIRAQNIEPSMFLKLFNFLNMNSLVENLK